MSEPAQSAPETGPAVSATQLGGDLADSLAGSPRQTTLPLGRINPDDVRRLAAEGISAYQIGKRLGCSDRGVQGIARRHGIEIRRSSRNPRGGNAFWVTHTPAIVADFEAGMVISAIARKHDLTKNQVVGRLNTLGRIGERRQRPKRQTLEFPPSSHCMFPLGPEHEKPTGWCGKPVREIGEPYCTEHHRASHLPARPMADLVREAES